MVRVRVRVRFRVRVRYARKLEPLEYCCALSPIARRTHCTAPSAAAPSGGACEPRADSSGGVSHRRVPG